MKLKSRFGHLEITTSIYRTNTNERKKQDQVFIKTGFVRTEERGGRGNEAVDADHGQLGLYPPHNMVSLNMTRRWMT